MSISRLLREPQLSSRLLLSICFVGLIASARCAPLQSDVLVGDGSSDLSQDQREDDNFSEYLADYGFMQRKTNDKSADDVFEDAVERFQKYMGLEVTKKLDEATRKLMKENRCGNTDIEKAEFIDGEHLDDRMEEIFEEYNDEQASGPGVRKKRYAHFGSKWSKTKVTYRVVSYSSNQYVKNSDIDREVDTAFRLWSEAVPIKFLRKSAGPVDIEIRFVKGVHDGCPDSFQPNSKVLAHAFPPGAFQISGDIHLNDRYNWSNNPKKNYRILPMLLHELGHSLGLSHSDIHKSIMFPMPTNSSNLSQDDMDGVKSLYGDLIRTPDIARRHKLGLKGGPTPPRCGGNGSFLFKASNCKMFYDCSNGYARLRYCRQGFLFNPIIKTCDYSYNVPDCSSRT